MSKLNHKPDAGVNTEGCAAGKIPIANAACMAQALDKDVGRRGNPEATLSAYCKDVACPPGQMGNSEIGHTSIGTGSNFQ